MKKLKIINGMCIALTILFTSVSPVFAQTNKTLTSTSYYTNLNGVELTEIQYNNLAKVFNEDTIATLTKNMVDILADDTTLQSRSSSRYVKTDTIYDFFGNIISEVNTEFTEKEAIEFINNSQIQPFGNPTHQTTMKRININITSSWAPTRTITVTVDWLSGQMPVTRSNDVIAIRPNKSFTININNISGYLNHNGSIVQSYTGNDSNVRNINGSGVGLSMPLPSGGTSMSHGLTIIVNTSMDPFDAYGSFQHAQSAVTLAQSKEYNLTVNQRTNIIRFTNSTTAAKYDNMMAVDCAWSSATFECS